MQRCYAIRLAISPYEANGEGGIRTLGSLLSYGALAKRCFQPLSHLTNAEREYRGELLIANIRILSAATGWTKNSMTFFWSFARSALECDGASHRFARWEVHPKGGARTRSQS